MALSFDRAGAVAGGFDRIGYCLELTGPTGTQWVWTAMSPFTTDARRLGLPTRAGQIVRQRIADLEVATNAPGLATGTGLTGYLEMWPNKYGPARLRPDPRCRDRPVRRRRRRVLPDRVRLLPGARGRGHPPGAGAPQTVLAVNGFTSETNRCRSASGPPPTVSPTGRPADNAGRLHRASPDRIRPRRRCSPSSRHPRDRQLYPRDAENRARGPRSPARRTTRGSGPYV